MVRRAEIRGLNITAKEVTAYLPSNYRVESENRVDGIVIISGEDSRGWTLQDYVLPRLASGNLFGRELDEIAL